MLADEEQRLIQLRQEKEELVQREITKQRQLFEKEAKEGQLDKLCATPFGVDVVGITEWHSVCAWLDVRAHTHA